MLIISYLRNHRNDELCLSTGEHYGVFCDKNEDTAVKIAVSNMINDIKKVCGAEGCITHDKREAKIVIQTKILEHKEEFEISENQGKLYIFGNDRRGTIYGIYDFCENAGVSPWYWFGDVPIKMCACISVKKGFFKRDYPAVEYRGIFLNDEEELAAWARSYMHEDGIGIKTYEKIFELILRLKGNYIWPAMHTGAFNLIKGGGELADRMGIVIGTSHCDMLLRSNQNEWEPWKKKKGYFDLQYDYSINGENRNKLRKYWSECVEDNKCYEVSYTMGMRGIHDSGFVCKNAHSQKEKVKLLEKIITDQQEIINKATGNNNSFQTFVPYKEVLQLYDNGLKIPEDITLIWTNDNYGNVRRYPSEAEQERSGGNGIYYHISYWAAPAMSYLFIGSTPLANIKNELIKCYNNGVKKLWILNVGALKPLEIETDFFMRLAWSAGTDKEPEPISFMADWIKNNFGIDGEKAAVIYTEYSQLTNIRKVEFMKEGIFSVTAFGNEAAHRMMCYERLFNETNEIYYSLTEDKREAFFQLFVMKIHAAYFINASFYFADYSTYCYKNHCMREADLCIKKLLIADDLKRQMLHYYNKIMNSGKWDNILTPESYPPPCTALYPCGTPALIINGDDVSVVPKEQKTLFKADGFTENDGYISVMSEHFTNNFNFSVIKNLGYGEGACIQADSAGAEVEYEFTTVNSGKCLFELFRFPTLNQNGQIRAEIIIDDVYSFEINSGFTDEKQGDWQECVYNGVEKVYADMPYLEAGHYKIKIRALDRYFTFSKFVIYTNGYIKSQLGAPESYHSIFNPNPDRNTYSFDFDMKKLIKETQKMYFCDVNAPLPREIIYMDNESWNEHWLFIKVKKAFQKYGAEKYTQDNYGNKNVFDKFGKGIFCEKDGVIAFGAEYALENSEYAFYTDKWTHTNSESNARTGIAMKAVGKNAYLSYKINASGGKYAIWVLMKYRESVPVVKLSVDDINIPQKDIIHNGNYHHGCTQQQWSWTKIAKATVKKGTHRLKIYVSRDICIDRIYITQGDELPPVDAEWRECERSEIV